MSLHSTDGLTSIDLDAKFIGRFEENQTRLIVCLGVLLPIDEVLLGSDPERVA